jgi:hypothetical protein
MQYTYDVCHQRKAHTTKDGLYIRTSLSFSAVPEKKSTKKKKVQEEITSGLIQLSLLEHCALK